LYPVIESGSRHVTERRQNAERAEERKVHGGSTKKEILDAYQETLRELENRETGAHRPEKVREDRREEEIVKTAETLSATPVRERVDALKIQIAGTLEELADKTRPGDPRIRDAEGGARNQEARTEGDPRHRGDRADARRPRRDGEAEARGVRGRGKRISRDVRSRDDRGARGARTEKRERDDELKEARQPEKKERERRVEEFDYQFRRESDQKHHALADELAALERDIAKKRGGADAAAATRETDLSARETALAAREEEVRDLEAQAAGFPARLAGEIERAVNDASERLKLEARHSEALLKKGIEGERQRACREDRALESLVSSQHEEIGSLSARLETAYGKVQNIAVSAVQSAAQRPVAGAERSGEPAKG